MNDASDDRTGGAEVRPAGRAEWDPFVPSHFEEVRVGRTGDGALPAGRTSATGPVRLSLESFTNESRLAERPQRRGLGHEIREDRRVDVAEVSASRARQLDV